MDAHVDDLNAHVDNSSTYVDNSNAHVDNLFTHEDDLDTSFTYSMPFVAIQRLLIFTSLFLGIFLSAVVIRKGCRNSFTFVIILLSGFVLESICALQTYDAQTTILSDTTAEKSECCTDFRSVALISNGVVLLVLAITAVRLNIRDARGKFSLRNALVTMMVVSGFGLGLVYSRTPQHAKQTILFGSEENSFYFSICQQDVKKNIFFFVLESVLLYIPAFLVMFIVYTSKENKDCKHRHMKLIQPCYKDSTDKCRICIYLEKSYFDIIYFFGFVFLISRPVMFMYGLLTDQPIRDILPPVAGIVQYMVLCVRSIFSLCCKNPKICYDEGGDSDEIDSNGNDLKNGKHSEKLMLV